MAANPGRSRYPRNTTPPPSRTRPEVGGKVTSGRISRVRWYISSSTVYLETDGISQVRRCISSSMVYAEFDGISRVNVYSILIMTKCKSATSRMFPECSIISPSTVKPFYRPLSLSILLSCLAVEGC
jgi:hypothetical protein